MIKAVGHAGTLDPEAAGVLPVCLGRATKIVDLLHEQDKEYYAEITLGINTDTLDATGRIVRQQPVNVEAEDVRAVLKRFTGRIEQTPPAYSALKVDGRSAYAYARAGQTVTLPSRMVWIHELEYLAAGNGQGRHLLRILCGKGTYIRVLAEQIGEALGCGAHLSMLIRTKSGGFDLSNAVTLEQICMAREIGEIAQSIIPVSHALRHLPQALLAAGDRFHVTHGNAVRLERLENREVLTGAEPWVLIYDKTRLLSIGYWRQETDRRLVLQPKIMLIQPDDIK